MILMRSLKNGLKRTSGSSSKSPARGSFSKASIESDTDLLCDRTVEFLESGDVCSVIGVELIEKSVYFEKLLKYHDTGCKLQLPEFLNAGFSSVLEFIRKESTDINSENVYDIFIAADYLLVPSLKEKCAEFMSFYAEKDPATALRLWVKCRSLVWPEIGRMALIKVLENFQQASRTVEFLQLPFEDILTMLESDQLNVPKEWYLLTVICNWIRNDYERREHNLLKLLSTIRIGMLTSEELDRLKNDELIKKQTIYYEMLSKWPDVVQSEYLTEETLKRMNTPRLPHEVILVFGGWCDGEGPCASAQVFNPRSNSWTLWSDQGSTFQEQTGFHAPRSLHVTSTNNNIGTIPRRVYSGCVILGSKVFLIGGFDGLSALKSTLCYDFESDSGWIQLSCMYEKRYYVSVTQCNGLIYALGGHNGENQGRLDSAEKFNVLENQWHPIAPMHHVRSDASAASLNGKVYIVGGFEGRLYHDTSESYDPETNSWTLLVRMSSPRGGVSCVAHGNYIYAIGGNNGTRRLITIERYDPNNHRWESCGIMNRPKSNLSSTVINDEIYIIGGWSDDPEPGILDSVEQYDINTQQCQLVRNLCFPASATCACTLKDKHLVRKYVHGGNLRTGEESNMELGSNLNNSESIVSFQSSSGDSRLTIRRNDRAGRGIDTVLQERLRRNILFAGSRRPRRTQGRINSDSNNSTPTQPRRRVRQRRIS